MDKHYSTFVVYRSYVVWVTSLVSILGPFLYFVFEGWPGEPHACIYDHGCFCEAFSIDNVEEGAPGVRQPVNTWFNLYSIITSGIVAYTISKDRKVRQEDSTTSDNEQHPRNIMRSTNIIADMYVFAALFLGFGSLWFHGSLTAWGNQIDVISMFTFVAFLPWYTIRRALVQSDVIFWIGYLSTAAGFSFIPLDSFFTISICVVFYLGLECYVGKVHGNCLMGMMSTRLMWFGAFCSILVATFFWWASHTGNFLCSPDSFWQPHGLVWHPLAGVVAVLLYFYWREADDKYEDTVLVKEDDHTEGQDSAPSAEWTVGQDSAPSADLEA